MSTTKSNIKKSTFINLHVATICFHIILSICIFIFSFPSFPIIYNQLCGLILLVVSILAIIPIYKSISYPFTINDSSSRGDR